MIKIEIEIEDVTKVSPGAMRSLGNYLQDLDRRDPLTHALRKLYVEIDVERDRVNGTTPVIETAEW